MSTRRLVLVAEPDPTVCGFYRAALRANGFDTDDAIDGRDALAKTFAARPAAIVLTAGLTFIDGYELCRLLRGDGFTAGIRIVFVTETPGTDDSADVARARTAGADAVVDRQGALESLSESVRQVLEAPRKARRATAASTPTPPSLRRRTLVRDHTRFATMAPPLAPPEVRCPSCDVVLVYDHSYVGGVSARHEEQWDYLSCPACGRFEFRHRTKTLRRATHS